MLTHTDIQVLIADDDCGFRETVVDLLEPHFQTIAVESGERAIEVVESRMIHAVILDMHMHCLTGLETLRILREMNRPFDHESRTNRPFDHESKGLPPLPCILMSSEVTKSLEAAAYQLQAYTVIRKPPTRQILLDSIAGALQL